MARELKRRRARRGTAAGAEERVEGRSARQIALGRCAARIRGIDGLGVASEVLENPFNDGADTLAGVMDDFIANRVPKKAMSTQRDYANIIKRVI